MTETSGPSVSESSKAVTVTVCADVPFTAVKLRSMATPAPLPMSTSASGVSVTVTSSLGRVLKVTSKLSVAPPSVASVLPPDCERSSAGVTVPPLVPVILTSSIERSSSPEFREAVMRISKLEPVLAIAAVNSAKVEVIFVPSPVPSKLVSIAGSAFVISAEASTSRRFF
jgi:hypothetical protein